MPLSISFITGVFYVLVCYLVVLPHYRLDTAGNVAIFKGYWIFYPVVISLLFWLPAKIAVAKLKVGKTFALFGMGCVYCILLNMPFPLSGPATPAVISVDSIIVTGVFLLVMGIEFYFMEVKGKLDVEREVKDFNWIFLAVLPMIGFFFYVNYLVSPWREIASYAAVTVGVLFLIILLFLPLAIIVFRKIKQIFA